MLSTPTEDENSHSRKESLNARVCAEASVARPTRPSDGPGSRAFRTAANRCGNRRQRSSLQHVAPERTKPCAVSLTAQGLLNRPPASRRMDSW